MKRAAIITDANMVRLGWQEKLSKILDDAGCKYIVFSEIEQNPSRATVNNAVKAVNGFGPDVIIALGGGSAIDVGKAVFAFVENPGLTWDKAIIPFSLLRFPRKIRLIAIPSTSGTGSEISKAAVITNETLELQVKKPILTIDIVPDIVISDPELCLTIPPVVTADTGLDVLSHGLEAYVSKPANAFTDPLSIEAIMLVFENLPTAYDDGSNKEAREKMHIASTLAGMAFANASLGLIHAMAHQLSSVFGVTHGRSTALLMTNVIRFNWDVSGKKYLKIAERLGIDCQSEQAAQKAFIAKINAIIQRVGVPCTLKDAGLNREDFLHMIDGISQNAMNDGMLRGNMKDTTIEDVKRLYLEAWEL
jgi:alcohol dehydrogenase class IV